MNHAFDRVGILKISASAIPSTGPNSFFVNNSAKFDDFDMSDEFYSPPNPVQNCL